MKIYRITNKKVKWSRKVSFFKVILAFILSFVFVFLLFGLLSNFENIDENIMRTTIISILIAVEIFFSEVLDYRNILYIIKDNKLLYFDFYDERSLRYVLQNNDSNNEKVVERILKNIKNEEGINFGEVLKILSVKERKTKLIVRAEVDTIEWKEKGFFFVYKLVPVSKIKNKKLIIRKDIDDFDELNEIIKNYGKSN